jgi:hypothetical protein
MDPITAALIAALAAEVTSGVTEDDKTMLVDAYNGLKTLLMKKFGEQSRVFQSVAFLESMPESDASKALAHESVVAAKADQDPDFQQAAQALFSQVAIQTGGQHFIQQVTSNYNASAQGWGNATVNVLTTREP